MSARGCGKWQCTWWPGVTSPKAGTHALTTGDVQAATATTEVTFRTIDDPLLEWYLACGEWQGRAGGYAIQGIGAVLVAGIEGDYLNVVGLPAALLVRLLAERFAGTYGFG